MNRTNYKNFSDLPAHLTAKDLQNVLHISKPTAYKLIHRDDFPAVRVGERRIVVSKDELRAWLISHRNDSII